MSADRSAASDPNRDPRYDPARAPSPYEERSAATTEAEAVERAMELGRHLMDSSRESNAEWSKRTGNPTRMTEENYLRGEDDVAAVALKYWGYGPRKAKRLIREYRESHA